MNPTPLLILVVTTIAAFCTSFAASSVNVALPILGQDLHMGAVAVNWVVTAYVLTSAVFVMPLGRLADRWGRHRVFRWGMIAYCVGSATAVFSWNPEWLIAARALTGLGAAMTFVTATAVLVAAYPPHERGRVLGINVAMVYFGLSAGPALGGVIVQWLGWRGLFVVHAALAAIAVVLLLWKLRIHDQMHLPGRFDFGGSLLYGAGLAALLIGVSQLPNLTGAILVGSSICLLVFFWIVEQRRPNPILPVSLFLKNRTFAFSNLAAMISYSATFAVAFFLSLYLEVVRGLSPSITGLLLISQPLIQAIFSPLTGRLSDRVSPRLLASLGMALTALGLAGISFLGTSTPIAFILGDLILLGLGFALFSSPNTNAIMGSVEKPDLGLASATVATMRIVGQMLSMALALVLMSLFVGQQPLGPASAADFLTAQQWAGAISAVLCALGIVASLARGSLRTS